MHIILAFAGVRYKDLWYYTFHNRVMLAREWRMFIQRLIRGWDDSETWSLDVVFARHILPRLRRFKEITICVPSGAGESEWNTNLDKMIAAFELIVSDAYYESNDEQSAIVGEGLKLFGENYRSGIDQSCGDGCVIFEWGIVGFTFLKGECAQNS